MSTGWMETYFAPVATLGGLLLMATLGLWAFLTTPAPPLHPAPADVPAVLRSAPPLSLIHI